MEMSDVELGDEVELEVAPRWRAGLVVSVRVPPEQVDRLLAVSDADGRAISQVVAEAVRRYLDERSPQALDRGHTTPSRA